MPQICLFDTLYLPISLVTQNFPGPPPSANSQTGNEHDTCFCPFAFSSPWLPLPPYMRPVCQAKRLTSTTLTSPQLASPLSLLLVSFLLINAATRAHSSSNGQFDNYLPHWSLLWCPTLNWDYRPQSLNTIVVSSMSLVNFGSWVNILRAGPLLYSPQAIV